MTAMTVASSIDPVALLEEAVGQASPDLIRELLTMVVNALMSVDADQVCGAAYGERTGERVNRRNGYRHREWDTRVGTVDLVIPKVREGSYYPEWLLSRRTRAEQALTTVVAQAYVSGVSTRRVTRLVETLGITGLSKSQVSRMAGELDGKVEAFRTRRLDGEYAFVAADALVQKVREGDRVVKTAVMVATGVNMDGFREVLGVQIASSETGASWTAFFRDLVARGLKGVKLVTSDAHPGLVDAIGATLPGVAWQRCRTHYAANLMTVTPKKSWPFVKAMLHAVYDQDDAKAVNAQFDLMLKGVESLGLAEVHDHLDRARADILTFTAFPKDIWRQVWSNNPNERLNKEIRRRTDVVGIFPDRKSVIRLIGAVLAEQHDEWADQRRYLSLDALAKTRTLTTGPTPDELLRLAA
jgi:transposase-like protein